MERRSRMRVDAAFIPAIAVLLFGTALHAQINQADDNQGNTLSPRPLVSDSEGSKDPTDPQGTDLDTFGLGEFTAQTTPVAREAYSKGMEFSAQGRPDAALQQFNQAVEADPSFARGFLAKAKALSALGQQRLAIRTLSSGLAVAEGPAESADIYLERGTLHLSSGQYQKALDDFDHAYEQQPTRADVAWQRGKALRMLAAEESVLGVEAASERMRQATAAFDRAIELQEDLVDARADRASLRADLGQTDEAIEDMERAVELQPEDAALQFRLAALLLRRTGGRHEVASEATLRDDLNRADLSRAIELLTQSLASSSSNTEEAPDPQQVQLVRAVASIELAALLPAVQRTGRYEAALHDCKTVLSKEPRMAAAHFQQGIVLRMLGRYRDAISAFSEALRLSPENAEARLRRGIAWFYAGELDLAMRDFQEIGVMPGDGRPWLWTGIIHARRGDHLEAIRAYSEAIDENPRFALCYSNRALSLMHLGHWQRAIDDLNAMILLDPDDAKAHQRRGLAQRQLGRTTEAERSFQKAAELARQ